MKKEILKSYKIKAKKIAVIYGLVDTRLFNPETISIKEKNGLKKHYQLPHDKKILLYHGEYHSFHGIPIIKKIALLSQNKDADFVFVFIGGKGENRKNIYFLDYVKFEKLPQVISLADLWLGRFDNSRLAQKTASSCMMQAMAMKVPVITFATKENCSIIKNGENGFLTKNLEADKILVQIEKILKNKPLLNKVGQKARMTVKKRFCLKNWQKINTKLEQL